MSILVSTFKTAYGLARWETANLAIACGTSLSFVERLRSRIGRCMVENSRERNNSGVWIEKMDFQNAIHLTIAPEREWERSRPRSNGLNIIVLLDRCNL